MDIKTDCEVWDKYAQSEPRGFTCRFCGEEFHVPHELVRADYDMWCDKPECKTKMIGSMFRDFHDDLVLWTKTKNMQGGLA